MEGDSSSITEALNGNDYSWAAFGLIIEDAKALANNLHHHSFHHVKHNGNAVAHALARRAKHCISPIVWMDVLPPELEPLLRSNIFP